MQKPSILIINDDGIHAPGLKHLWKALKDVCTTYIVAPSSEKSGTGVGLTLRDPIHIEPVAWEEQTPAWQVTGTPADCVRMATRVLLNTPPDLIVSGINRGANSGRNLLYSGTVGGVIEGAMREIPGIAFSCNDFDNPRYDLFEAHVFPLVQYLLSHPLKSGSFLNVNFPSSLEHKGYRLARHGLGYYKEEILKRTHPTGRDYYWMGGSQEDIEEHEESDVSLLKEGYITVVPVQVKEFTDLEILQERKAHFTQFFN